MLLLALLVAAQAPELGRQTFGKEFRHAPTAEFGVVSIEGFTVLVSPAAKADPALLEPVLAFLPDRLRDIRFQLPRAAFEKLRAVRIWVEHDDPAHPGMVFHPSAEWLRAHGYNVDKAGDVEIGNLQNFLAWHHEQPSMVLHELAHAWVFRFLDQQTRAALATAFEHAQRSGKYEAVLHWDKKRVRAYALTDVNEYFAELSEAYFGQNDFYPFVRAELSEFDPDGFAVVERAWNGPPVARPPER